MLEDLAEEQRLAAEAVRDLLDLSISSPPLDPQLPDQDRFGYDFTPPQSWAPPLAGTLTRLSGGTRRRRRIRQRLTAQIPAVADQQLGRARADLQTQLQDAGRALTIDLQDRAAATLGRLQAAVIDLTARPTGTDSTPERIALQRRAEQLLSLLGRADAVGEGAGRTTGDTEPTAAGRGAVPDRAARPAPRSTRSGDARGPGADAGRGEPDVLRWRHCRASAERRGTAPRTGLRVLKATKQRPAEHDAP